MSRKARKTGFPRFEQLRTERPLPAVLRIDNGPEFPSTEFIKWAENAGMDIRYIQPRDEFGAYAGFENSRLKQEDRASPRQNISQLQAERQ